MDTNVGLSRIGKLLKTNYQNIIEFQDVTFFYPEGRALFKALSMKFKPGGFYIIKGPSGVGKSSLLKLMNRIEDPSEGVVLFKDRPLASYPPQLLRRTVLYIQQTPIVVNGSVKENLLLPFTFKHNSELVRPDDDQLNEFLNAFYLDKISLSDHAQNLSVGQLQRICLIRGFLLSPEVILLDEPTSALDEESARIVESSTARLYLELGQTVIMVSHKKIDHGPIVPSVLEVAEGRVRKVSCNPQL